jgi:flagellar biosynthesis anti-sigma factor FlgM
MRIDSNQGGQPAAASERQGASTQASTSSAASAGSGLNGDQAQLSGAHALVQALAAQAAQLPEVRGEKVSALRQAVQSGNYHLSPESVAGAVFSHLLTARAA